jgi:autotransporter passenger strand-loop-strand repeat protein
MTTYTAAAGQTLYDLSLLSGDVMNVDAGGVTSGATANSGSQINLAGDGYDTTLISGGAESITSGGVAYDTKASYFGDETVSAGGVAIDATIYNVGAQSISSGGAASHTHVSSGGYLEIYGGGVASGAVILDGGQAFLYAGGSAYKTLVSSLYSEGIEEVEGGVATESVIDYGVLDVEAGVAIDPTLNSGSVAEAAEGGVISGGTANAGRIFDEYGGSIIGMLFRAPAQLMVSSNATISDSTLLDTAFINAGGSATALSIGSGGVLQILGASDLDKVEAGGEEQIVGAGVATSTTVGSGGSQVLTEGGEATGTILLRGGAQVISIGAVTFSAVVQSGGGVQIAGGGGLFYATVAAGGAVDDRGSSYRDTFNGGREVVYANGLSLLDTFLDGAVIAVSSGGVGDEDTLQGKGEMTVLAGGADENVTISSGGEEIVSLGGGVVGASLIAGGKLVDDGELRFDGAGSLAGTLSGDGSIVQAAAGDLVLSDLGTPFAGEATIDGGTIELARAGALGTGSILFDAPKTGSSVLQIDAAAAPVAGGTFANTIEGFSGANEDIDLRSIAFVAGATAKISGSTLVLTDGGKTYAFKIAGSAADAYAVLTDGHGGTLIDPKAVAFAQTAAAFAPSDAGRTGAVSSTSPSAVTPFAGATASAGHL